LAASNTGDSAAPTYLKCYAILTGAMPPKIDVAVDAEGALQWIRADIKASVGDNFTKLKASRKRVLALFCHSRHEELSAATTRNPSISHPLRR
jgi:hypothetical protein